MLALKDNDLATAFTRADQWVSHAAADVGAREILADVLLKQARYEEAAVVIAAAMVIESNRPSLLRKASLVALQRGDLPGATGFAEQWRATAPSDAWAHDHLSILYLRNEKYEQARAANSKALDLDPTNANFLRRAEQIRTKAG
jgi:tetratricopeptide (TPR) repeat protein